MNSFGVHQNPYDQYDAQDAAEQHYLKKADRGRNGREDTIHRKQLPAQPSRSPRPPQAGNMNQGSLAAAQEATSRVAQMNASKPHRTPSTRAAEESMRTQRLPQTTYSPFPSPKPLARKPVSRQRTDSPSSVLSFASEVPPPKVAHGRSRTFDVQTARPQAPAYSRPSSPAGSARPSSRPSSPAGSARPSTPNSIFQFFSSSRRGSDASEMESQRPRSRRGSFTESIRRASHDLRKGIDIVKMDEDERARWRTSEKVRMEHEVEERRRQDPSSRPKYQQEYLDWKAKRVANSPPEMDAHERTIALDAALKKGEGMVKLEAQRERDATASLTAGEEIALLLAKAVDPLRKRRGRQDSDDSGMDFADCGAPIEVMESCQRCNRPMGVTAKDGLYLTEGYCHRCHKLRTQEFWDTDSPMQSDAGSVYSNSSRSNSPRREIDEEEYMKIVVNKRIRRIRRTIYSDPGNPFLIFDFDEEEMNLDDAPPPGFWGTGDLSPAFSGPSRHVSTKHEFESISGHRNASEGQSHDLEDARDSPIHAPTPQRIGTPALIKDHSIPSEHRDLQRSSSQRKGPALPSQTGGSRNTAFYGFYDNVLHEYRQSLNRI